MARLKEHSCRAYVTETATQQARQRTSKISQFLLDMESTTVLFGTKQALILLGKQNYFNSYLTWHLGIDNARYFTIDWKLDLKLCGQI